MPRFIAAHLSIGFPTPGHVRFVIMDLRHFRQFPRSVAAAGQLVPGQARQRTEDAVHGGVADHEQPPTRQALCKALATERLQLAPAPQHPCLIVLHLNAQASLGY